MVVLKKHVYELGNEVTVQLQYIKILACQGGKRGIKNQLTNTVTLRKSKHKHAMQLPMIAVVPVLDTPLV